MKVLLLAPHAASALSGLAVLVRETAGALIAQGARVDLVVSKPAPGGVDLGGIAVEDVAGTDAALRGHWLPHAAFERLERHALLHRVEEWIARGGAGRVVAVGVEACGLAASFACRLRAVPLDLVVTWHDAHQLPLEAMAELELACAAARSVCVANPALAARLDALGIGRADTVWVHPPLRVGPEQAASSPAGRPHVCTTGELGPGHDLEDLLGRVAHHLREGPAQAWVHAGVLDPRVVGPLASRIALAGLADVLWMQGALDRQRYEAAVRGATCVLRPAGALDTAMGAREARAWGVPVELPPGFPEALLDPGTPPGAIDVVSWARRILA